MTKGGECMMLQCYNLSWATSSYFWRRVVVTKAGRHGHRSSRRNLQSVSDAGWLEVWGINMGVVINFVHNILSVTDTMWLVVHLNIDIVDSKSVKFPCDLNVVSSTLIVVSLIPLHYFCIKDKNWSLVYDVGTWDLGLSLSVRKSACVQASIIILIHFQNLKPWH